VLEYMETINSASKSTDLLKYRAKLAKSTAKQVNSESQQSLASTASAAAQNRSKKLGAIMGIAKRSRSIHYTECPSKSKDAF
jgi:hypothetical protein